MPAIVWEDVWREHKRFIISVAAGLVATVAAAQMDGIQPAKLFPWATFDPDIPTQEQILGVAPGSRPLRSEEVVRYFGALADASPRAQLRTYARSWEGRDLVYLVVCDERTQERLDAFRAEHARRVDPRGRPAAQDETDLRDAKAVAWMAYSIHGDELSSADAAVALAYWLVAGEDERAKSLRDKLVVLIDPLENPDGRTRFLAQTPGCSLSQIAEVLRVDQRQRWLGGAPVMAEEYLERYPQLRIDDELVLDLIYNELLLREKCGATVADDAFLARFPQYAHPLKQQMDLHRALATSSTAPILPLPAPVPAVPADARPSERETGTNAATRVVAVLEASPPSSPVTSSPCRPSVRRHAT